MLRLFLAYFFVVANLCTAIDQQEAPGMALLFGNQTNSKARAGIDEAMLARIKQKIATIKACRKLNWRHNATISQAVADTAAKRPSSSRSHVLYKSIAEMNTHLQDYMICDMFLTEDQLDHLAVALNCGTSSGGGRKKRQAYLDFQYPNNIWPGPIPYTIDPVFVSNPSFAMGIRQAVAFFEANTPLIFVENGTGPNQLYFQYPGRGKGCSSMVGRQYDAPFTSLWIGDLCQYMGIVSHEIMHALSFWHEQQRYDRDAYITLNVTNINYQFLYLNFMKLGRDEISTFNLPYEYGSNMHYGAGSFTNYSAYPGIIAADPNFQYTMGGEYFPSFLDIYKVNLLYNFTSKCASATVVCQYGGYPDPKNCAVCRCPYGFAGVNCQSLQSPTFGACNGKVVTGTSTYQTLSGYAGNASLLDISPYWNYDYGVPADVYSYDCYYQISCPTGKSVQIQIVSISALGADGFNHLDCEWDCFLNSIELKMAADFRLTGFRLCCNATDAGNIYTSATNLAVIIALSRFSQTQFTLKYQCVAPPVLTTTKSTVTTTAACATCGPLVVSSPVMSGFVAGQYSITYSSNLNGCKTAEMRCINPTSNKNSSIVGVVSGVNTFIDTETSPLYSVAEFTCQPNGQYIYTSFPYYFTEVLQTVFATITCVIPTTATTPTKPTTTTKSLPLATTKPTTAPPSGHTCQTCPISAMNFTWPASAFNPSTIVYAPQVTYSINATTGCAQISLDCSCSGQHQEYVFQYSNGATYNNIAPTPVLFGCNAASQLWQNNYVVGASTATNFVCYRQATIPCQTASTTKLPATTIVNPCQTCPISAMNFTWYRPEAPNDGLVDYAPQVSYSINATTGCAQISLDCSCSGQHQEYVFQYSNGATYNNIAPSPVLFGCNGAAQLWQNNYATPSTGAMTATNFICYRQAIAPCQTASTTKLPATTIVNPCQTCPISAMNFTWYRPEAPNDGIVDYAPRVTYSINATTGCAQISLDCSCGGEPQEYIFAYSNGAEYGALSPAIFGCNGAAQLWQYGAMTVTNFICYRSTTVQCQTASTTKPPTTTTKSINCPSGWTFFSVTNSCYLAQYNATWDNAQSYCKANGANLASIHSLAENNFVEALPSSNVALSEQPQYSNVPEMTWIGLRAAPTTLNFVWIDGTNYDYSIWRTDTSPIQPNRVGANSAFDCAELLNVLYNNTWNQASCVQVMRSFVCKRSAIGGSAISNAKLNYIIHTMFQENESETAFRLVDLSSNWNR